MASCVDVLPLKTMVGSHLGLHVATWALWTALTNEMSRGAMSLLVFDCEGETWRHLGLG